MPSNRNMLLYCGLICYIHSSSWFQKQPEQKTPPWAKMKHKLFWPPHLSFWWDLKQSLLSDYLDNLFFLEKQYENYILWIFLAPSIILVIYSLCLTSVPCFIPRISVVAICLEDMSWWQGSDLSSQVNHQQFRKKAMTPLISKYWNCLFIVIDHLLINLSRSMFRVLGRLLQIGKFILHILWINTFGQMTFKFNFFRYFYCILC